MKLLDLFSGIGGFSLGAEYNNIETVGFVEKDVFCQKVLKKHWPTVKIIEDIRNVTKDTFEPVDIVSGGFPCQPFSVAGKRKGTNDDRYLWDETIRVVSLYKPRWFVGENVEGIVNIQNGMVLRQVQDDLEKEGFEVQCGIIPASGIGAWHQRKRVWIIAYSNDNGLKRGQSETCNKDASRKNDTSFRGESSNNTGSSDDDGGDKKKSRIDERVSRSHNGDQKKSTSTKGLSNLSKKSDKCETIKKTNSNEENHNRTLVQKRQIFQLSKSRGLGDDETSFKRNQVRPRNDNTVSHRVDTNDVSNTHDSRDRTSRYDSQREGEKNAKEGQDRPQFESSRHSENNVSNSNSNLRGGRRAILQSGENKIWGFYNEKSEQTSHDLRSETIRCDVVSGEQEDVSNSHKQRTQIQTQGQQSSIKVPGSTEQKSWWQTESELRGVPDGVSYELDKDRANRIKALGNSIVPQIAYQIFYAIISAEGKNRG